MVLHQFLILVHGGSRGPGDCLYVYLMSLIVAERSAPIPNEPNDTETGSWSLQERRQLYYSSRQRKLTAG